MEDRSCICHWKDLVSKQIVCENVQNMIREKLTENGQQLHSFSNHLNDEHIDYMVHGVWQKWFHFQQTAGPKTVPSQQITGISFNFGSNH